MTSSEPAQMLKVALSTRSHVTEEIPRTVIRHYLGGRGLGSYLLYQLVPGKVDPLGAHKYVIFTAGSANGTNFPIALRQASTLSHR